MAQSITFHGAARTVTGSKHLLTLGDKKVLVDCGLFQGSSALRALNWLPCPFPPSEIDAIIITHAHIDHIGWLPKIVREGYTGPILATRPTIGLAKVSLPDSGRLQEEEARYLNRKGLSRHKPALPLYTEADAYACLKQFEPIPYNEFQSLPGKAQFRFLPAGHILGSAFAEIYFENGERVLMSGDLGRFNRPVIKDPVAVEFAEYLVLESTYGDRSHAHEDPEEKLRQILNNAFEHGSCVLVPSFAIGRTQELLYFIYELQKRGQVPRIPIYLDSPMGVSATNLYSNAKEDHDQEMKIALEGHETPLQPEGVRFVRDKEESKALNSQRGPMMIIAGSGMANGGRIVHHLMQRLSNPNNVVLFTGYQSEGTLGRRILEGDPTVQIMGETISVAAQVEKLNSLSAHAGQDEIMHWLGFFKTPPRTTFLVHGEPPAQDTLRDLIVQQLGWKVEIPEMGQRFEL